MGKILNFENECLNFIIFLKMLIHDFQKYQSKTLESKVYIHKVV